MSAFSAAEFMASLSTAGRISGADSKTGGAVVPEQGDCAAPESVKLRWIPGEAHSHTYYLHRGERIVGKVHPNPSRHRGGATWLPFVDVRGRWHQLGGEWQIQDARDAVEAALALKKARGEA